MAESYYYQTQQALFMINYKYFIINNLNIMSKLKQNNENIKVDI